MYLKVYKNYFWNSLTKVFIEITLAIPQLYILILVEKICAL